MDTFRRLLLSLDPVGVLARWRQRQKRTKVVIRSDARDLLEQNPDNAYFDAHRLACRCELRGDRKGQKHWRCVADLIARTSDNPTDPRIVRAIGIHEAQLSGQHPADRSHV